MEIEYQEIFTKSEVEKNSVDYVLQQIAEVHSADKGWEMGEPVITPNPDGRTVKLEVPLKKYRVEKPHTR